MALDILDEPIVIYRGDSGRLVALEDRCVHRLAPLSLGRCEAGDKLRGMVCGTCDNPYTMAALDDVRIEGDLLKFNLLHEDWADGDLPTFYKHFTCHVGWNELRCSTAADHMPPPRPRPRRRRPTR